MHVVSVINYKGGVGKTTTTANLAAELAWRGKDVLIIDLDPQASLTFSFIKPEEWQDDFSNSKTIKNWFDSFSDSSSVDLNDLIFTPNNVSEKLNGKGQLDMIASHLGLINVDLELATELGGATLKQSKRNFLKVHKRLSNGIQQIDSDDYDLILIDCPPNFNIVTKTAIVASDNILIPAKPDYLSTLGIDYLIRSLNQLISDFNEYVKIDTEDSDEKISPEILGVVFTMIQIRSGQPITALRPYINQTKKLGISVFDEYIRENKTIFSDAPQYGVPVVLNNYSAGTYADVVSELEAFVTEFINKSGI
ncbi:MAG: ParA family protein [Dehalococcoidia bacterium]|nr:Sporulation initiation inhibitor protein Soj [Chloroflexota bacterium]